MGAVSCAARLLELRSGRRVERSAKLLESEMAVSGLEVSEDAVKGCRWLFALEIDRDRRAEGRSGMSGIGSPRASAAIAAATAATSREPRRGLADTTCSRISSAGTEDLRRLPRVLLLIPLCMEEMDCRCCSDRVKVLASKLGRFVTRGDSEAARSITGRSLVPSVKALRRSTSRCSSSTSSLARSSCSLRNELTLRSSATIVLASSNKLTDRFSISSCKEVYRWLMLSRSSRSEECSSCKAVCSLCNVVSFSCNVAMTPA